MRLSRQDVDALRQRRYRLLPALHVRSEKSAVKFINECGFVLLFPVDGIELPSLWDASGSSWADGGWRAWEWKEILPQKKLCAYTKCLRKKGTFISWELYPAFVAAFGAKEHYEFAFREGRLTTVEKRILDILNDDGPMDTHALRRAVGLPGKAGTRAFHAALTNLQATFRVTVVGGDISGWSLHTWDLVEAWAPKELLRQAYKLSKEQAIKDIIERYVQTVIVASVNDIRSAFGWEMPEIRQAVQKLVCSGRLKWENIQGLSAPVLVAASFRG